MTEPNQDAPADSSSALGEAIASSPEALETPQEAQNPPAETQGDTQEPTEEPRVPYSRLKEVVDEKNWYRQQVELMLQRQQSQQQPTAPQELGGTPEEREFWKAVDKRAELIAEQKLRQISPVIDAGRAELAQMKVLQFRASHPDIKPNSPEEVAIAEKIGQGYLPEDAYRTVMWDKKVAQAEKQGNTVIKQKIEAKKLANVEQRSIPQGATAPTNKKLAQKEFIKQQMEAMEKDPNFGGW